MKKKIIVFLLISIMSFSSNIIPELKPSNENESEFTYNEEDYRLFIEGLKILKKESKKRTEKEKNILNKAGQMYDYEYQTEEKYFWEIIEERSDGENYKPIPYNGVSTSHLKENAGIKYGVNNIYDNSYKTAWVEGAEGYGIGEKIELYCNNTKYNKKLGFDYKEKINNITKVYIYNGYMKNSDIWKSNSRVKKLKMYVQGKEWAILNLRDYYGKQEFNIPIIKYNEVVKDSEEEKDLIIAFEIMDIYPGSKYKDTAITEIIFYTPDSLCFPLYTQITLSDNSVKTIDQVKSGDEILTYNSADNKFEKTKVVSVAKVPHNNLVEIDFGDRVITSTDDHPYLSENGWKSCKPNGTKNYKGYEGVKEMKKGDKIYFIGENGKAELKEVKGIKKVDKKEMCYTITKVENGDNFIADGAVVGVEELK